MAKRKEDYYGGLPKRQNVVPPTPPERIVPPPEEPKFYGAEFAALIQTGRKMGTLRERHPKRAGLTKGMRLTGHVHPDGKRPSIADIDLVILDVHHGRIRDLLLKHKLAFFLDGVGSSSEAVRVLQNFSRNHITPDTEVDYFTFIRADLFDQLEQLDQEALLAQSTEEAMLDERFSHLFLPSLCQNIVWRGLGLADWINFLERAKIITPEKATAWRNFRVPGSQTTTGPAGYMTATDLQELLELGEAVDMAEYKLCVLGDLEAIREKARESLTTRYILVPCRGSDEASAGHSYALVDQAGSDALVRWVDEQEAENLIFQSESLPWDQSVSHGFLADGATCPDCQKVKS